MSESFGSCDISIRSGRIDLSLFTSYNFETRFVGLIHIEV